MNIQAFIIASALAASTIGFSHAAEPIITWSSTYDAGPVNPVVGNGRKVAMDGLGNVIIAGHLSQLSEWLVTKYNPDGTLMWTNRFKAGGSSHWIRDLALDPAGNVYVTGESTGAGTSLDYATIKYLADGTPAWTNRFAGPGNTTDFARAIGVDSAGSVYVTGFSDASVSSPGADYVTIKYAADGVPMWTNRFNGPPGNDHDAASALALDSADNLYVTGYSAGTGTADDYATIKYRPDGTPVWTNRFNGLLNATDEPTAIALDSHDNVYVTGRSHYFASDGNHDYATIKYQADGTPVWTNLFSTLRNATYASLAVDGMGDVHVTGTYPATSSSGDFAIIKYRSDGTTAWVNRYNGPGNSGDEAYAVALDGGGNVYVTGYSFGAGTGTDWATIKYQPNGAAVWTNRFTGPGNVNDFPGSIAVDNTGGVYVTGGAVTFAPGTYYSNIKYLADGTSAWTNGYTDEGTGGHDTVSKAVADSAGNLYVVGTSYGLETISDYATIKYHPDGTPAWTNRYDGLSHTWDEVRDLAVDGLGNVHVTGDSRGLNQNNIDIVTIKYLADGTAAWTNRLDATGGDTAIAIAVDGAGNVFVAGNGEGLATGCGYRTIKYRPDGSTAWVNRYRGPDTLCAYVSAIAVDSAGNAYVTGRDTSPDTLSDWATIKYNPNGMAVWTNRFNAPSYDDPSALTLDSAGNVYVTGTSYGSGTNQDYATIKYRPDGTGVWTNFYNGTANTMDFANEVAVDNAGRVYVTGLSGRMMSGSGVGADYATIKYYRDGTPAWTNRYDGLGGLYDDANDVAVDRAGNVYVTGSSTGADSGIDHATIKYRPDGTAAWTNRLNGPVASGSDSAGFVLPLASGDVVVVGNIASTEGGSDWFLYRLAEPPDQNQVNLALIDEQAVRLRFTGVPGQAYQVQRAPAANGPWTTIAAPTTPPHGLFEYLDTNRPPDAAFYRIALP